MRLLLLVLAWATVSSARLYPRADRLGRPPGLLYRHRYTRDDHHLGDTSVADSRGRHYTRHLPAFILATPVAAACSADNACSGHGSCADATGTCVCDLEYGGTDCGASCPGQCGGHGNCAAGGLCHCRGRFGGARCEIFQPDVGSCRASVGEAGEGRVGIKPCLQAMPADCVVKTLELLPGVHNGSQNVEVSIASNESVALVGRGGGGGATIDGGGTAWLLSVAGNGSLTLANLTLQHGFLPGGSSMRGAALSVNGQGVVRATGVHFLDNEAAGNASLGGAVSLVDSSGADAAQWLDARFTGCAWEGTRAGMYSQHMQGKGSQSSCR